MQENLERSVDINYTVMEIEENKATDFWHLTRSVTETILLNVVGLLPSKSFFTRNPYLSLFKDPL